MNHSRVAMWTIISVVLSLLLICNFPLSSYATDESPVRDVYSVPVKLIDATDSSDSFLNDAICQNAQVKYSDDGFMTLDLSFQDFEFMGVKSRLTSLRRLEESLTSDMTTSYPNVASIHVANNETLFNVEVCFTQLGNSASSERTMIALLSVDWEKMSVSSSSISTLDINNLSDGVYIATGNMFKSDRVTSSMSDVAINHNVMITKTGTTYKLTMTFSGLSVGGKYGYLGTLSYYESGYDVDASGAPMGTLASATVDSIQTNADGSLVSDAYGTNYPKTVSFNMIEEAKGDGFVPLQVVVPLMEAVAVGAGTQSVYLKLDYTTLAQTTADDPRFNPDTTNNNSNNTNNPTNGNTTNLINTLAVSTLPTSQSLPKSNALGGTLTPTSSSIPNATSLSTTSSLSTTGDVLEYTLGFLFVFVLMVASFMSGMIFSRRILTCEKSSK